MGIFDRAKRVVSSNVNALIDRAEDPRKIVELTLEELKETMRRGREDVVSAVASEKQLRAKCDELTKEVERWEQRAVLAVKASDDALAREALNKKARVAEERASVERQREQQFGYAIKLRDQLEAMKQRYDELAAKKGTIGVKAEIARAGSGTEALGAKDGAKPFDEFRRMEEKIEHADAEALAMREIEEDEMKAAELESKFRRLEIEQQSASGNASVDDELAAIKKRIRVK